MSSTQAVLEHHLKCFGSGDLEGILADYEPDAILFTPRGPVKGVEGLRKLFKGFFDEFGKPSTQFQMGQTSVEGEYAYITWNAETADNSYKGASDTFIIRNGKIVAQSFAAAITPKK